MASDEVLPPYVGAADRVILFDGVCKLCAFWSAFVLRFDRHQRFTLAMVQSPEGQAILRWLELPTDTFETVLLIEGAAVYGKSTAALRIVRQLPLPWPLLAVVWIVPRFLRDWAYDAIARNRYALFGKYTSCPMPPARYRERFLGEK